MSKTSQLRTRSKNYREAQLQRGGPHADSSQIIATDALIEILAALEAIQAILENESGAVSPERLRKTDPKGGSK